jgi:hypothetical protein
MLGVNVHRHETVRRGHIVLGSAILYRKNHHIDHRCCHRIVLRWNHFHSININSNVRAVRISRFATCVLLANTIKRFSRSHIGIDEWL